MSSPASHPRVGVAAVIPGPNGHIIFGRRKGSHGAGQWAFPGGHLEHGESILECAERETLEETALRVKALRIMHVTNDVFVELGKHYVTLFVLCELVGMEDEQHEQQQPQLMEPEKCEEWVWLPPQDIAKIAEEQLFLPIRNLLGQSSTSDLGVVLGIKTEGDPEPGCTIG